MLSKLIKHEYNATKRIFYPTLAIVLVVFLINGIIISSSMKFNEDSSTFFDFLGAFVVISILASIIAIAFIQIYITIKRYAQGVYGDEGYLTNTLPVKPYEIIISKATVMTIFNLISGIAMILAFLIMFFVIATTQSFDFTAAFNQISMGVRHALRESGDQLVLSGIIFLIANIISIFANNLIIYACISIAHMKSFVNKKYLVGILTYVFITIAESLLSIPFGSSFEELEKFGTASGAEPTLAEGISLFTNVMNSSSLQGTIIAIVFGGICFFVANHLISKKLNLE